MFSEQCGKRIFVSIAFTGSMNSENQHWHYNLIITHSGLEWKSSLLDIIWWLTLSAHCLSSPLQAFQYLMHRNQLHYLPRWFWRVTYRQSKLENGTITNSFFSHNLIFYLTCFQSWMKFDNLRLSWNKDIKAAVE